MYKVPFPYVLGRLARNQLLLSASNIVHA